MTAARTQMTPKLLYKYASAKRMDIFLEKKIRFTQPCFLNDPFEFRPGMPDGAGHFEAGRAKKREGELMEKSRLYGVLCLTEKSDSIPMWAHYAGSHTGFAIGFDTGSAFFKKALAERKLQSVQYRTERVNLTRGLPNQEWVRPDDIFQTKSTDWEYEKEWRWVECCSPDNYAEVRSVENGERLYLRPFLPECIQEVVLGYRIDPNVAESIQDLKSTAEYQHLKVFKVALHKSCYKLEIEPV